MQPWHLGKLGGFQLATPPVSLLTPTPHPCLHRFFCGSKFPDSTQIIQIKRNDCWPRVSPPSFYYKACLLQSLFLYSVLSWNPYVALHNVQGLTLWGCEYMWRINRHLSHLIHLGLFGLMIPPSHMGWTAGFQNWRFSLTKY